MGSQPNGTFGFFVMPCKRSNRIDTRRVHSRVHRYDPIISVSTRVLSADRIIVINTLYEVTHYGTRSEICGGAMKILAAVHPPDTTRKILQCLGLPTRPPPLAPAVSGSAFHIDSF